jgi:DNA-binding transcriptional MerR regulator
MDDTPVYNLKAVVRETGLKPDTLRAWERRYGLPAPDRSGGGHRLYSERDIQILKWLVARQQAGLSISRAAELWHRLSEHGQDPAQLPEYAASGIAPRAPVLMAGQALEELRSAWLEACLAFDEPRAEAAVGQALAQYPAESICLGLFLPALARSGSAGIEARSRRIRSTLPPSWRSAASRASWPQYPTRYGRAASWSLALRMNNTPSCLWY